jgi:PAS domain S-box-containing protein
LLRQAVRQVKRTTDAKDGLEGGAGRISNAASRGPAPSVDALLEGIGEGFFALDSDWRFTAFNHAAEEIFSLSRAAVIGRVLWEVSPRIVGTDFERRYRRVMSERTREEFESFSALRPDRYHEVRAFPFGEGIGAAFRDITDRRKVTETLRERELELARVQRIGGVGGLEVDLRNGFRNRRSPEYLHLHGLPPSAANETHEQWVQRIHPDDRVSVEKHFRDVVAGPDKHYKSEYRIVRPSDGEVRWIRAVAEIERDENGCALKLVGAHLDITDRKEAEQVARASEERLRAVTDALPLLISYVDKDRVFRFANKPYEDWFGRPLSEIVGLELIDLMDPAMYEARRPFVDHALAGETVTYEADFTRAGGTVHTEIVHVPHRDENGRVAGMYSVVQDITTRKLAERRLSESEERFRAIADSAPAPIWVSRLDGLREFVNRAYHEFLGVSLAEALTFDWRRALHSDDLPRILGEQRAGESSLRPFTLEARYLRGDGQWRWLRSESQPRWGPNGNHIGFIGVALDITALKEAEQKLTHLNETLESRIQDRTQQLAATEALIQTFFRHSSECHAVLSEQGHGQFRYEEINPATLRLYGKIREQVIGYTIEEVFGAEAGAEIGRHLAACLRQAGPYRYERRHGEATIEAIATPAPPEPGAPRRLVVSAHDVTERRRLEQQLRQSQKMEAVGQLTGGVAHDFNNLLTLVLGGLELIGRHIPNLPDPGALTRIERAKDMALQGVRRATALTSRLLAFSRQQPLTPQSLDANKQVAGICELLRRTLGEAIVLETVLAGGLWRTFADPNQLENALLNLALNARDAMPDGGKLTIETANASLDKAYVASLNEPVEAGQYVMIAVADTGAGMDQATRERAFDPFFTTKEVGKGTGLGLSQVYGFARQSAGHVRIYSEIGEGATIKIYLPRRRGDPGEAAAPSAPDVQRSIGAETILVVEDDDALREYTQQILMELGYLVRKAGSGAAALAALDGDETIDLLLTDVVMPGGIDGRQLADQAVRLRPGLKVLFMTGYTRNAILHHGRLDAGVHLIGKPFSFQELAAKVRERLDAAD